MIRGHGESGIINTGESDVGSLYQSLHPKHQGSYVQPVCVPSRNLETQAGCHRPLGFH